MKHKKVYRENGCVLLCGKTEVASHPNGRGINFTLDACPKCGMEIYTSGFSPETDKVLEYIKKA